MGRKKTIACLALVCGVAGLVSFELRAAGLGKAKINWQTDLLAAHKLSVKEQRPLLIVVCATWCGPCRKMEQDTLHQEPVIDYVNSKFIPVHLDFDKNRKIAEILEITSLPASVVLSPQADLLGSVTGYVSKEKYRKWLGEALEVEQTVSR